MANEAAADDDFAVFTPGGSLQLRKPDTDSPATIIPPAERTVPTPSEPSILGTAFNKIVGGVQARMSADLKAKAAEADRVWGAAKEGYETSRPDLLPETGPTSRPALEQYPINRDLNLPALDQVRNALGLLGGAYRGAQQMVKENLATLDPLTSQVGRLDPTGTGFGKASGAGPLSSDVPVLGDAFVGSPGDLANITAPVTQAPPGTFYNRESAMAPKTLTGLADARAAAAAPDSTTSYATGHVGYQNLDNRGTTFSPDFVSQNIDSLPGATSKEIARALAEDENSPVAMQLQRLQNNFKGKSMTIQEYQGMMDGIKNSAETAGATTPAGKELFAMRHKLQDQFEGATGTDLSVGDASDMQTFKDANKSYQQAHKQEIIEKMIADSKRTDNETTSFRTKVKNFLGNEAKTRGWTDEEIQAVSDAAERGLPATALHAVGGRLVGPLMGGVGGYLLGAHHDPLWAEIGGSAGIASGALWGEPFRGAENMMARQRIRNALSVLGKSVPPRPMDVPPPNFMPGVLPWNAGGQWTPPGQ